MASFHRDVRNRGKLERLRTLAGADVDFKVNLARGTPRGPYTRGAWSKMFRYLRTCGIANTQSLGSGLWRITLLQSLPVELSDPRWTQSRHAGSSIPKTNPLPRDVMADLRTAIAAARAAGIDVRCSYARIVEEDL